MSTPAATAVAPGSAGEAGGIETVAESQSATGARTLAQRAGSISMWHVMTSSFSPFDGEFPTVSL
jgi:dTDP-4-dehydrorhamnose reductase